MATLKATGVYCVRSRIADRIKLYQVLFSMFTVECPNIVKVLACHYQSGTDAGISSTPIHGGKYVGSLLPRPALRTPY